MASVTRKVIWGRCGDRQDVLGCSEWALLRWHLRKNFSLRKNLKDIKEIVGRMSGESFFKQGDPLIQMCKGKILSVCSGDSKESEMSWAVKKTSEEWLARIGCWKNSYFEAALRKNKHSTTSLFKESLATVLRTNWDGQTSKALRTL